MIQRALKFLREVRTEISKVTWPTRDELLSSTFIVIAFSVAFSLFVGAFDLLFSFIIRQVLR